MVFVFIIINIIISVKLYNNNLLDGDIDTGKTQLGDYLNATEAFPAIARELAQDEKSIRRRLGPK